MNTLCALPFFPLYQFYKVQSQIWFFARVSMSFNVSIFPLLNSKSILNVTGNFLPDSYEGKARCPYVFSNINEKDGIIILMRFTNKFIIWMSRLYCSRNCWLLWFLELYVMQVLIIGFIFLYIYFFFAWVNGTKRLCIKYHCIFTVGTWIALVFV